VKKLTILIALILSATPALAETTLGANTDPSMEAPKISRVDNGTVASDEPETYDDVPNIKGDECNGAQVAGAMFGVIGALLANDACGGKKSAKEVLFPEPNYKPQTGDLTYE